MKITIVSKQIAVTDAIRNYAEKKLQKIQKYFDNTNADLDATITLSVQKNTQAVEVLVHTKGLYLKGKDSSEDLYASIDRSVDKIERQITKYKDRITDRKQHASAPISLRMNVYEASSVDANKPEIIVSKDIGGEQMGVEEAVMQMELLDKPFFAYRNEKGLLSVVYRRDDGNIGLIES